MDYSLTKIVWECICDCGNTIFVARSSLKSGNTKSCGCLRKEKKPRQSVDVQTAKKKDLFEISRDIVEKHSIKTINHVIYYLTEDGYTRESVKPFIEKVLVTDYELPTRVHKEVFRQIEIISRTTTIELSDEERIQILHIEKESVEQWMSYNGITIQELMNTPTVMLYSQYAEWCKLQKSKEILGKKQFFKYIADKYNLRKKQKSDTKRYFVPNT